MIFGIVAMMDEECVLEGAAGLYTEKVLSGDNDSVFNGKSDESLSGKFNEHTVARTAAFDERAVANAIDLYDCRTIFSFLIFMPPKDTLHNLEVPFAM
mmetsp:Transcript_18811/g.26670  ORF Transcript_18811/g.26670 Transcript_18811/m.26670 type:complete len:98 (-) Transcript_18811:95-388(-)